MNLYYLKCILDQLPGSRYDNDFIESNKLDNDRFVKFVTFLCDKRILFRSNEELEKNNFGYCYNRHHLNREGRELRRDDLVVNPQFFLPDEINGKQLRQNVSLNIVRIRNAEVQMFKRDIRLDLNNARDGELERCAGDRGMTYKKIYDFRREAYGGYDVWQDSGNGVLLDLRNNKGGKLSDMRKVFVKIFKSYQLNGTAYPSEGIINFVVTGEKGAKRPRVAIMMNGCTASSAEIFIRLCKYYFGAVLIGTETYGKDVICKNIQVDGFSFSLPQYKYRIAGIKTESGGIVPDICMPDMEWPERGEIMEQCDRIWEERRYAEI